MDDRLCRAVDWIRERKRVLITRVHASVCIACERASTSDGWRGQITTAGTYQFFLGASRGATLKVNGSLVIDNDGESAGGSVRLLEGAEPKGQERKEKGRKGKEGRGDWRERGSRAAT